VVSREEGLIEELVEDNEGLYTMLVETPDGMVSVRRPDLLAAELVVSG
jgi:hypothetical protein